MALASDKRGQAKPPVVEVRGLRKSYGDMSAVAGIDLEIAYGEVFAILGPNGAGKTTTVEILEGFRQRDSGEVSVLGVDPEAAGGEWRSRIGVVMQESEPEPELTVQECVSLYAGYYPTSRSIQQTLDMVGLSERPSARCGDLSGGQRRRLDVALALVGDPELLFLDEPTTGFDPAARRATWDVIAGLRNIGKTIVLTTHYMEEAEHLADRIAVFARGRIVADGTPDTLGGQMRNSSTISFRLPSTALTSDLPSQIPCGAVSSDGGRIKIETSYPLPLIGTLADWAESRGIEVADLEVSRPTLEDVYLKLTEDIQ